jgi:hypothetical protein
VTIGVDAWEDKANFECLGFVAKGLGKGERPLLIEVKRVWERMTADNLQAAVEKGVLVHLAARDAIILCPQLPRISMVLVAHPWHATATTPPTSSWL